MDEQAHADNFSPPAHLVDELRALVRVAGQISRSLDSDQVLKDSLEGVQRVLGGEFGCFLLIEPTRPAVQVAHGDSLPAALHEQLRLLDLAAILPSPPPPSEYASPVNSLVALGHRVSEILKRETSKPALLVPLTAQGRAVGIMLIVLSVAKFPLPPSVDLLMSIGEQIGMAIENARLHASVRQAEEWRRQFMENSPDAFWEMDSEGRIKYVNDAACRLLGYERAELLGMSAQGLTIEDNEYHRFAMVELERVGTLIGRDARVTTRSGEVRIVNYATNVVRDDQGRLVGYQAISRDVTERRRLQETLRQRNEELKALNNIARILSHPLELGQSLDQVCEQIVSITGMDTAAVGFNDEPQQFLNIVAQRGVSASLLSQAQHLGLDDPLTRRIAVEGQVLAVNDVALHGEPSLAGPRAEGYHAGIGMPIKKKESLVGAIFVGSKVRTSYEQADVDLMQNISNQIGVALENAELFSQMQERVGELNGLAELSAACVSTLDPHSLSEIGVEWTRKLMDVDGCGIRLLDGGGLRLGAARMMNAAARAEDQIEMNPVMRSIVEERTPRIVNDVDVDLSLTPDDRQRMKAAGTQAAVGVPLSTRDRVIGFMSAGYAKPHHWSAREIDLLTTIANQIANAIGNAQLYQSVLSEQRTVQAIFESGLSGLYATDAEDRIVMFNRAAERVAGWTLGQVQGKTWEQVFGDAAPLIHTALKTKEPVFDLAGRELKTRDGREIPVAEAVAPLFDEQGAVTGAVGAFWDLTREKQAELSHERFLLLVAHQLRSPLTALLSALQLLERQGLSRERRSELWNVIRSDGARLRKFADEFLDLEAAIKSPRPVQLQPLEITSLARRLVRKFQAERSGHRFRVRSFKPKPIVAADPSRVEDVLRNLLDNAVTYSAEGSLVSVAIKAHDEDAIDIAVQDQGEGIPREDQERIFEPFYRVSKIQGRPSYGHGLGLSIAKEMVKEMGGQIWMETGKGRGSTFHFTLRRAG
ncbi:MAG: PAS domain S-box protein [Chloroflexota bacterium]|nr:PAS domain S-box protein [Chloroflexota bacterium]